VSPRSRLAIALAVIALCVGTLGLAPRAGTAPATAPATATAPRDAGVDADGDSLDDDTPDTEPDATLAPDLAALEDAPPSFDATRTTPLGFDHIMHVRQVGTSGAEPIACRA